MRILYWNLNKRPATRVVTQVARDQDLDILILSECALSLHDLLTGINAQVEWKYKVPFSPLRDPVYLTRLPRRAFRLVLDSDGVSIRRVVPPIGLDFTLIAVHLPSKLFLSADDQAHLAIRLARVVDETEAQIGHMRTVIVGDFNMDPFEPGVVGAEGFHAIMVRNVVQSISRKVMGKQRHFFYNPMWSHYGEFPSHPPGTYFYRSSLPITYFWHMFDQVILRPELLPHFEDRNLKILTTIGGRSLLDSTGRPDASIGSDHLPVVFSLDLVRGGKNGQRKSLGESA